MYALLRGLVGGGPNGAASGVGADSVAGVGGCDVLNLILGLPLSPGVCTVGVSAIGVEGTEDAASPPPDDLSLIFMIAAQLHATGTDQDCRAELK